jgi:hypothetical protein
VGGVGHSYTHGRVNGVSPGGWLVRGGGGSVDRYCRGYTQV